jgi:hypothetical protein
VITARLVLPRSRYDTPARRIEFFHELFRKLESRPGVLAAGGLAISLDPAYGVERSPSRAARRRNRRSPVVGVQVIGGGYFRAFASRAIRPRVRLAGPSRCPLPAVSSTRRWPRGSGPARARSASASRSAFRRQTWRTVEGVVGDVSHDGIDAAPLPEAYLPLAQSAEGGLSLVVRSSGDPGGLAGILRGELASLDPDLPLYELRPMEDRISDALAQPRFLLEAFSGFAALTLLLSALAWFTLVAHDVGQRRREVGIRMALGARSADIVRLFVSRVAALIAMALARRPNAASG